MLICALVAIAMLRPWVASHDPLAIDIDRGLTLRGAPLPPSTTAPLGTDELGRDVWARVAAGTATSLEIASSATLISLLLGLSIGLCAGYAGRWIDNALMRLVDLTLAFPFLLLAILLAALLRGSSLATTNAAVIVTLGSVGWTTMARVIRGKARALATSDMVLAARALGASPIRIMLRHIVPNVAGVVIVVAAFGFAQNLLAESVLSYLGLGAPPPAPTWGHMLYEGQVYYRTAPWLTLAPGIAIVVAVVAFNLVGDGLSAVFDPRAKR